MEKNKKENILCLLDKDGYIFPGYEIVKFNNCPKFLGAGGFSSVYEMFCPERPKSRYVLKVMGFETNMVTSESFRSTTGLQHFLSEETPYICRVLNAREVRVMLDENGDLAEVTEVKGERWDEDGIHLQFILMEQLDDIIKKNRFGKIELQRRDLENEEEVVKFALQVGQALHVAHSRNVLHRDVKLENVFWDKNTETYKLGDFGIAKYVSGGNAETVVYTNGYGAPEIERHLFDYYNATADIYSFGITLYLLLNDFRFPGSEGYYVNAVQYSSEFVFPAPVHASEEMTRIIRKMCQYYQEDRYQSMTEVLIDLIALKAGRATEEQLSGEVFPDFDTETYREEKIEDEKNNVKRRELSGRAKRKEEDKLVNEMYIESSAWHFVGITLMLTLIMRSMQVDMSVIKEWQFWVLPIMLLLEVILLRVKEFHVIFGIVTLVVGIYLGIEMVFSVPSVIMIIGLLTGIPVIAGACVASTVVWAFLVTVGKFQWLDFLVKYDLSWILIIIVFFMLHHYTLIRIDLNKTTHMRAQIGVFIFDKIYLVMAAVGFILSIFEKYAGIRIPEILHRFHLVRTGLISFVIMAVYMVWSGYIDVDEQELTDENEMDERRDGEHSATTE